MHCEQFESRLQQLLDRRMQAQFDDRLLAHARHCAHCRETLHTWTVLRDGFEMSQRAETSPGFTERVMARVPPAATAPRRRKSFIAATTAFAAMLVVALIPLWQGFYHGADHSPETAAARSADTSTLPEEPQIKPRSAQPSLPTSHESVPYLPVNTMAGRDHPFVGSVTREHWHLFRGFADQLAAVPVDRLETVEKMPGGLRPIANSFQVALMLLRRTLPGSDSQPNQRSQSSLMKVSAMVG